MHALTGFCVNYGSLYISDCVDWHMDHNGRISAVHSHGCGESRNVDLMDVENRVLVTRAWGWGGERERKTQSQNKFHMHGRARF